MTCSKNNILIFRYMLILLLLLSTGSSYAQDEMVEDTNIPTQTKINILESQPSDIINIKKESYKESTIKQYNKLCQIAEELLEKDNYEKALESLNKAIKLCSETEKAYSLKSICLRKIYKLEEAKENAQKAYKLNSNSYIANEEMGAVSCLEGNYEKALFFLNKAESLNKNYERTYLNRGLTYYLSGNYEKSIADFNTAIKINPNSIFSHEYRAYAYLESDGKKNALSALKDVNFLIQHDPKNMTWYRLRAKYYAYMNNVPMALADINKAVKKEPENFQSYIDRLEIYKLINASDELVNKDLTLAENYAGNDTKKILELAKITKNKNDNKMSERLIDKVLNIDPNNSEALSLKSYIQVFNKDYDNALISLTKLEKSITDPKSFPYMLRAMANFGMAGLDNKQLLRQGISDIDNVINTNVAENNIAYSLRGAAHIALGEYQLGINDIEKAEELGPLTKDTVYWLGLAKFQLGKFKINIANEDDNVYMRIICNNISKKTYSAEELSMGLDMSDGFDNTSDSDISAKINFLSLFDVDTNFISSNSILKAVAAIESPYANIEQAYERDGMIITLPYKNVNGDYGNGVSKYLKDKIIAALSYRALVAATQEGDDIGYSLIQFLETADTKQKIDGLLSIIDNVSDDNTDALNKIVDNIDIYDTSNKTEQDKAKKILRKAYLKLGTAAEENDGMESAMNYYNTAIQYGYPKFDIYSDYAYYYFNKEDYFKASKWATSALNIKADANLYALRGDAKAELNDYDGAIYDYTKALGYNSKLYDAYFARGQIYFKQKKWSMAQADYTKYATYNKNEAAAPFNIATCLQNQGKKQAAIPWYEKAKSLYQENGNQSGYNDCVRRINEIKGYNRSWW